MFKYIDLTTTSVGGMRVYETPEGNFYPSITTVLGHTMQPEKAASLKAWQKSLGVTKAQKVLEDAGNTGTVVHLLAERYLKKEPLIRANEKVNPKDLNMFNALKLKLNKVEEIWCQETALYSDCLSVAGRTDLIGVYKSVPSVIDYKTSISIKNESRISDYKLQLCAYAIMHNEMFGTDIRQGVILMTSAGGFPQEFVVETTKYKDQLKTRINEFYEKLLRNESV